VRAADVSGGNGWSPVSDTASLQEVIDALTKEKLPRLPLVNAVRRNPCALNLVDTRSMC
jgi:hypothetical protein